MVPPGIRAAVSVLPIYVNMPHRPRYLFLDTDCRIQHFTYSDLHISMGNEKAADTVQISCAVENTGSCEGDESSSFIYEMNMPA